MSKSHYKYYAVKKGRQPGIYRTWDECRAQVDGFEGAKFKGFKTLPEAQAFMGGADLTPRSNSPNPPAHLLPPLRYGSQGPKRKGEGRGPEAGGERSDHVIVYTDGAALGNPGPGGYGIVILNDGDRQEQSGGYRLTTNNRMELMGAIVALRMLKSHSPITLYTDSRYVVRGIREWVIKWQRNGWKTTVRTDVENMDLWKQLIAECDKHEVTFEWVRGHHGNKENERCDELSKSAAMQQDLPADTAYESQLKTRRP